MRDRTCLHAGWSVKELESWVDDHLADATSYLNKSKRLLRTDPAEAGYCKRVAEIAINTADRIERTILWREALARIPSAGLPLEGRNYG